MFRIRTYLTHFFLLSFDCAVTVLCHFLFWRVDPDGIVSAGLGRPVLASGRTLSLVFILVLWLLLSSYFRLYHSHRMDSPFADGAALVKIGIASWIVLEGASGLLPQIAPTPQFLDRFQALTTLSLVSSRVVLRLVARELRRRGRNVKKLVLVAAHELGDRVAEKIEQRAYLGYRIVRRLAATEFDLRNSVRLSEELEDTLKDGAVDDVIIALPAAASHLTAQLAAECESQGVNVRIVPDLFPFIQSDTQVYDLDGIPLINVRYYPAEYLRYAVLKRIFDVSASLLILILSLPFYVVIALLVKLSSPGPVHFVQERVGMNGKKFKMLKFRTMRVDVDPDTHWTVANDPYVTAIGRCLRRSNLDEIPQFWNVLNGDMSIVGPRPERPVFQERFRREVPEYMVRHYVKSGITGWAQVNGWRGDTSISQRVAFDLYYIRNWALLLDLKIVLLTVVRTFFHPNAY